MQYRLSTIFLVFFVVATSLSLFGPAGIWIAFVLFVAALCLNKTMNATVGAIRAVAVVLLAIVAAILPRRARPSATRLTARYACIT
jgi:hypothetical protein